jgi:hypothetical protein
LSGIEVAELSKEGKLLDIAYDSYLALSLEKNKALEVQYQKARLIYDRGEYGPAAEALRNVALSSQDGSGEIKKQGADLSLDALVLLKDDARIEAWASDYGRVFSSHAAEFTAIARKSVLTQSAGAASSGDSAGLDKAWKTLSRFDHSTASVEDRIAFYKNKLILAEKTERFVEARDAVENLLRQPQLAVSDQQYALSRKAWLAEMILDFDTALTATEKLTGGDLKGGEKWLKLAMYAELASKDPRQFYGNFLKESNDEEKSVAIAAQLVRDSKEPLKEIEKNKAILAKRPAIQATLFLEMFAASSRDLGIAKKALATTGIASTPAGKVLSRSLFLDNFAKLQSKILAHQLDGSNQKKLAQTLKARVQMLEDVEKLASRAIESGDWTSQLVSLDLLARQNDRFYQDVLSLPVPAGLSAEDEQQYLMLLSQQAAPHQVRAADAQKKVSEFWANESALSQLEQALDRAGGGLRGIVLKEAELLASVAPEAKKPLLAAIVSRNELKKEVPSLASIEAARQAVRENPMSREKLEALLGLERKMGRQTMVAYLENRILGLEASPATEATDSGLAPKTK